MKYNLYQNTLLLSFLSITSAFAIGNQMTNSTNNRGVQKAPSINNLNGYRSGSKTSNNELQNGHTTVSIQQTQLIGSLSLSQNLFITSQDITNSIKYGKDLKMNIGTFCTYTNDYQKRMAVMVSTSANGFYLNNTKTNTLVKYDLYINNQIVPYSSHYTFQPNGGDNHTQCTQGQEEKISIIVPSKFLKTAVAGTYDIFLHISVSNIQ